MNTTNYFKRAIKRDWYIQGFNAVPLFLGLSAASGISMKWHLGYGYTSYLFHYRQGYGEMGYLSDDFVNIWQTIKRRLQRNRQYLKQARQKYNQRMEEILALNKEIDQLNLKRLDERQLIELFRHSAQAQIDTVGIGHLVDAIGVEAEKEFRQRLVQAVGPRKDFNQLFTQLTVPSRPSFVSQQETDLHRIAQLPASKQSSAISKHFRKYYWIQNSYTGPRHLSVKDFSRRLKATKRTKQQSPSVLLRQKDRTMKHLRLDKYLKQLVNIIDFTTVWQDERKAYVLKNISYLARLAAELARRARMPLASIYHLAVKEVITLPDIHWLKMRRQELKVRQGGTLIFMDEQNEYVASGKDYRQLYPVLKKMEQRVAASNDMHGAVANGGTAIGRAVVCRNIASLSKVSQGDVIVASMTRPEFMPALKKAAAIVTDEGGITCHAAIVARELGIPCVIGTKVSTKVIRDGMMIEVRANHGIVRIIK
jgi:phosphoenolpyruvate synthase/pyruvate phosphate dikinase